MKIDEIIINTADAGLQKQKPNGSFPSGHNGLHRDSETAVRNTSHWLVTLLKSYELSGKERFKSAAETALSYLYKPDNRPQNKTYLLRNSEKKDNCNGLIGQAWVIEALVRASQILADQKAQKLAEEIFLLHPFDERSKTWRRVETDGTILRFDKTFNHQLWFAAAGAELAQLGNNKIEYQTKAFTKQLLNIISVQDSGIIEHKLKPQPPLLASIKILFDKECRHVLGSTLRGLNPLNNDMVERAIGYHSYNLYALSILKNIYPDLNVWDNKKIKKAVRYISDSNYAKNINKNPYAYSFNLTGIENAYALSTFQKKHDSKEEKWLERQFQSCYSTQDSLMNNNSSDPETLSARVYEICRFKKNYNIKLK